MSRSNIQCWKKDGNRYGGRRGEGNGNNNCVGKSNGHGNSDRDGDGDSNGKGKWNGDSNDVLEMDMERGGGGEGWQIISFNSNIDSLPIILTSIIVEQQLNYPNIKSVLTSVKVARLR